MIRDFLVWLRSAVERQYDCNRVAWRLAALVVVLGGGLLVCVYLLALSQPRKIGFVPGSVKLTRALLDGERVIVLTGPPANCLGQIQGIGLDFRFGQGSRGTGIYLDRYVVTLHPFSRLWTHSDGPVLLREKDLSSGSYEVFYWSGESGYLSAGKFTISPALAGRSHRLTTALSEADEVTR